MNHFAYTQGVILAEFSAGHTHSYLPLECRNTDLVGDSLAEKWLSEVLLLNSRGGGKWGTGEGKGKRKVGRAVAGDIYRKREWWPRRDKNHFSTSSIPQYGKRDWVKLSMVEQYSSEKNQPEYVPIMSKSFNIMCIYVWDLEWIALTSIPSKKGR